MKKNWENQLDEICAVFGFSKTVATVRHWSRGLGYELRIKSGRAVVAFKDGSKKWTSGESPLSVPLDFHYEMEEACENIVKLMSGKELIVRGSEKPRKSDFGFTRIRTERHIRLPEFSSAEELKLKLEIMK